MTQTHHPVVTSLLAGDPAIRWQTLADLTAADEAIIPHERHQVALQGWGARLVSYQESSSLWGGGWYSPKWTSTTYTMLLLRQLGLEPGHPQALKAGRLLLDVRTVAEGQVGVLAAALGPGAEVWPCASAVCGGALPGQTLPSFAVALPGGRPDELARALRLGDPPAVGRIDAGRLLLDVRTVGTTSCASRSYR